MVNLLQISFYSKLFKSSTSSNLSLLASEGLNILAKDLDNMKIVLKI